MKVLILAGGLGTRISEETETRPKPMIDINGRPLLWHVMSIYAKQGFHDFLILSGYLGEIIEDWASKLNKHDWNIEVLDTGLTTLTAGRIKRGILHCENKQDFLVTYGDGVGNVNIKMLLDFHRKKNRIMTITASNPQSRFGFISSKDGIVTDFSEKVRHDDIWINAGFFVINRRVISAITDDRESFEFGTIPELVKKSEVAVYQHNGFWKPVDTLREKIELTELAEENPPPWLELN
jgi:glucose-1-phosphate cytidylyltransferase